MFASNLSLLKEILFSTLRFKGLIIFLHNPSHLNIYTSVMPCYIDVDIYCILGVSAVFKLVAPRHQAAAVVHLQKISAVSTC